MLPNKMTINEPLAPAGSVVERLTAPARPSPAHQPTRRPPATAYAAAPPAPGPGAFQTPVSRGGPGASGAPCSGCRAGRRRSPGRAGGRLRPDPGAQEPRWQQAGAGCSRPGEGPWPGCHEGIERIDAGLAGHDQAGAGMGRCAGAGEGGEGEQAGQEAGLLTERRCWQGPRQRRRSPEASEMGYPTHP